ncbi:hypothetical protein HPB49_002804 [Dermacentor silvarum]|uniref:Uncharacterized protein n=1 Tax=Dermacentor silvarum TaxID=543639 RepID=A0ACB8DMK9_DERSI|nr:hypothetical protein HPB49_002804 [Dermacentor silvarum]
MGTPSCDPLVAGGQSASAVSVSAATPLPQQPDCDTTPIHSLDTNGRAAEFGNEVKMEDELFSQFSDTVSGDAASGTDQFFWFGDQSGTQTASAEVDVDHEVDAHNSIPPQDLLALTVNFAIEFGLPWNGVEALQKLIAYALDRNGVPATKYLFKKLAQLEREHEMMKNTIARLMTEIAVIKKGSNRQAVMADKQPATPEPMEVPITEKNDTDNQPAAPQPMKVPMVEKSDTERPAKKRTITNEQERVSGRSKSVIREMLSALRDIIKEINEKFWLFQSNMASMEEHTNQRISKIESFLENVVAPVLVPKAPTHPAKASTSNSAG